MSAIQGTGYGSAHDWECGETIYRATHYRCKSCGWRFVHDYPSVPNIFQAMKLDGVPERCNERKAA